MYRTSVFIVLDSVNVVMTALSCGLAAYAARHGAVNTRPLHAAIAALSAVYCAGYLYLVIVRPDPAGIAQWSNTMRGVGVVAWPVAWISWSIISVRLQSRVGKLRRVVEERDHILEDAA